MLGRKAIVQFVSDNVVNLLGFISTFIIARFMGPTALGVIAYNLSLVSVLSIFSDLGFGQAHVKRISEGGDIEKKTGTYLFIRIILTIFFTLSTILFLFLSKGKDINIPIFILIFLSVIINQFSQFATATFQGLQKTILNNLPILFGRLAKTVLTLIVVLFSLGTLGLAITYALESLVVLIISIILFRKVVKKIVINKDYLKSYTGFALPLAGITISSYLIGNADKLLIKNFWDVKEVGLYFGVQSLMSFPQSVSNALMTIFFPRASELLKKNDINLLNLHLKDAIKYLSIIIFPICSLLILYSKEIPLIIFGSYYPQASGIMIVGSLTALTITLIRPYSNILYALEKGKTMFVSSVVCLIVLIISDLLLIPESLFGISLPALKGVGAAIGIFNMWFVNGIFVAFLVKKHLNIVHLKSVSTVGIASISALGIILLIKNYFPLGILGMILGTISFLVLYIILLLIFKIIKIKDLKYFMELININKMTSYLKEEIKG